MTEGPPPSRVLVLAEDRALKAWLAATVLAPLGVEFRFESSIPGVPGAVAVLHTLGSPLAREESARALGARWRIPVVVLLGQGPVEPSGPVIPVRWPHSPLQVQEALLAALGRDPASHRRGAPRPLRGKEPPSEPQN